MPSQAKGAKAAQALGGVSLLIIFGAIILAVINRGSSNSNSGADASTATSDPQYNAAIGALIRASGYECPHVALDDPAGNSPYGPSLDVVRGPDNSNADLTLHYFVYPKRFLVTVCKPWSAMSDTCN